MIRIALGAVALVSLLAIDAAAIPRTFVSKTGTDTGNCTRVAPCRALNFAVGVTDAGGEIVILDSAGYGGLTITKSLTIVAPPGVQAGIAVSSGDGIVVDANPTDVVVLRNLSLSGLGGDSGIRLVRAGAAHIENCDIRDFAIAGIFFDGPLQVHVFISDSVLRNNHLGIVAVGHNSSAATSRFEIVRTRVLNSIGDGMHFEDIQRVTIVDSTIARSSGGIGLRFTATATSPLNPRAAVDRTAIVDNAIGVMADGDTHTAFASLSASVVSGNGRGLSAQDGGAIVLMTSQVNGNTIASETSGTGVINTLGNNMRDGGVATPLSPE